MEIDLEGKKKNSYRTVTKMNGSRFQTSGPEAGGGTSLPERNISNQGGRDGHCPAVRGKIKNERR